MNLVGGFELNYTGSESVCIQPVTKICEDPSDLMRTRNSSTS